MDEKKFENELYELWTKLSDKDQSFTMIIVKSSPEGPVDSAFIISSNCPVCHSQVLADVIEDGDIKHTVDLEKSQTSVH